MCSSEDQIPNKDMPREMSVSKTLAEGERFYNGGDLAQVISEMQLKGLHYESSDSTTIVVVSHLQKYQPGFYTSLKIKIFVKLLDKMLKRDFLQVI